MGYPLELSGAEMADLVSQAMSHLRPIIDSVDTTPIDSSDKATSELLDSLREPLPIHGDCLESVLSTLLDRAMPPSLSPISGGFMGYVPGGGIFLSALADLISGSINRYVGATPVAPGLSEIEATVIRWFASIVGFSDRARGFMISGGSLANQSALTVARTVTCGEAFHNATVYLSNQSHNCLEKAARLIGLPAANIRIIDSDAKFRLSVPALKQAIRRDREAGMRPMFVAANAGTTNTGAIDPLEAVARVCRDESIWFHIDAAYGGFFMLTERGKTRLAGMSQADSIALDPHKTLFLPYGTGALLVRDGNRLKQTYQASADYLPDSSPDEDTMDFRDLSPELTRPFRGLRVWLPLKVYGAEVFTAYLDEKLDLARRVAEEIEAEPALDLVAAPELSILAFAVAKKRNESLDSRNARSERLMSMVNQKNRVHLTGTRLRGLFVVRVAVGVYRTHESHIQQLMADLRSALTEPEELND